MRAVPVAAMSSATLASGAVAGAHVHAVPVDGVSPVATEGPMHARTGTTSSQSELAGVLTALEHQQPALADPATAPAAAASTDTHSLDSIEACVCACAGAGCGAISSASDAASDGSDAGTASALAAGAVHSSGSSSNGVPHEHACASVAVPNLTARQNRLQAAIGEVVPFTASNFVSMHTEHSPSGTSPAMGFLKAAASQLMHEINVDGGGAGLNIQIQVRRLCVALVYVDR